MLTEEPEFEGGGGNSEMRSLEGKSIGRYEVTAATTEHLNIDNSSVETIQLNYSSVIGLRFIH